MSYSDDNDATLQPSCRCGVSEPAAKPAAQHAQPAVRQRTPTSLATCGKSSGRAFTRVAVIAELIFINGLCTHGSWRRLERILTIVFEEECDKMIRK